LLSLIVFVSGFMFPFGAPYTLEFWRSISYYRTICSC